MKAFLSPKTLVFVALLSICACKDDKPTSPPAQAYAVSLEYQNYIGNFSCLRLMVGTDPINQCGLGTMSLPIWAGDYSCKLYGVRGIEPDETLFLIATSPLHLDRGFTCIVDGNNIYWLYFD